MRCNWQRWLWGLIPLFLVSWVAIQLERDRIQQDLTGRAKAALAESGSRWAGVEVSGRDLVLTGGAILDGEPPRAEQTLRKLWGVREVENRAILPPRISPFIWSARRRGSRMRLGGYVPDRPTRQAVIGLTKAAMPGLEVVDRMNTGRGVPSPDTWLAGLSFALKQLSVLKQGDARFDDLALTISGEAEDPAAFKTVTTALKSGLPNGIALVSSQIAAPVVSPFTWSAQFTAGQLVMAGHVAGGEKTRTDLLAAAKVAAPSLNTVDRMEPAEGAPKGWDDVAIALMKVLVRLDSGTIEMKDAALTVGGVATDEQQAQSVRAALRASIPPAFTLIDQIRVRPVKAHEPPPVVPAPPPTKQSELAPPAQTDPSTPTAASPTPQPLPESATTQAASKPEPRAEAPSKEASPPPRAEAVPAPKPPAEAAPPGPKLATPAPPVAPPAPDRKVAPEPQVSAGVLPPPQVAPPPPPPVKTEPMPEAAKAPPPAAPAAVNVCQGKLNQVTSAGHINFATDSATLDSTSFETLDRLAAAAKACPSMRIAIEGHTDAEGGVDYNQRLSVRRAAAVVTYLVRAGADREQLEVVGYGSTRPAAPNDTAENMAKNRRIEFSVRQK